MMYLSIMPDMNLILIAFKAALKLDETNTLIHHYITILHPLYEPSGSIHTEDVTVDRQ